MTTIRATARGYKSSKQILQGLTANIDSFCEKALDSVVAKVQADINSDLQNKQHVLTGELLGEDKLLEKSEKTRIIGTRKIQGRILEHGRGIVRPKNVKVLKWTDPHTGEDIFAKESGAVDPDPVFEPNILKNIKHLSDVLSEEVISSIRSNKRE